MKAKVVLIAIIALFSSPLALCAKVGAEINSSQYVTILNLLSDPAAFQYTMTDVNINYYDSLGKCWSSQPINYSTDYTAGAGGNNGCKYYPHVGGINKIDIHPTRTDAGGTPYYSNLDNVIIDDPSQLYTVLLIKQKTAPTYNSETGQIATSGTITVDRYVLKTSAQKKK